MTAPADGGPAEHDAPPALGIWRAGLLFGAGAAVAVIAGIAAQWIIVGSPAGHWWYRYLQPFHAETLFVGVLASAAAAALVRLPEPSHARHAWALLLTCLAVGLLLQAFIRTVTPFSLETLFVSDGANSFYSVTQQQEPSRVLSAFNRVRRESALHAQSNMPGKVMLLYALEALSARTDVLPWLLVALSSTGAVLMYIFVRALFAQRRVALYAALLYLFVPGRVLFLPLMNTVTPVVLFGALCVLMRWLQTGRTSYAVVLGALLYGLVFFEPLPLVTGLLFGALSLRAIAHGTLPWQRFVLQAALMTLTFVATAEIVRVMTGFDLAAAFRGISTHAIEFNLAEERQYARWVGVNLWEFAFATGMCQAALALAALGHILRSSRTRAALDEPLTIVTLSLFAVLIATDLIGINRGEVVRLWIFLACLFQIPAAYACTQMQHPAAIAIVLSTSIVQTTLATSMTGFIVP